MYFDTVSLNIYDKLRYDFSLMDGPYIERRKIWQVIYVSSRNMHEQQYQFHFVLMLIWSYMPHSTRFIIRKYFCRDRSIILCYLITLVQIHRRDTQVTWLFHPNFVWLSINVMKQIENRLQCGLYYKFDIKKEKILNCSWKKKNLFLSIK